jgi:hypothetical protein
MDLCTLQPAYNSPVLFQACPPLLDINPLCGLPAAVAVVFPKF